LVDVFLSYSHQDTGVADDICAVFHELGVEYFRDKRSIDWGDPIDSEVRLGLDQARLMLLIVSPASLKSWWVIYEVGYAAGRRMRILPFLTHPSLEMPPYLGHLKHCSTVDEVREYFSRDEMRVGVADDPALEDARFRELQDLMPDLLAEMRQDLKGDDTGLITEFAILPSRNVIFSSSKARFAYFEDKHAHLTNKLDILEERGFILDVTTGNAPIYRFTEEFRTKLRGE